MSHQHLISSTAIAAAGVGEPTALQVEAVAGGLGVAVALRLDDVQFFDYTAAPAIQAEVDSQYPLQEE